MTLPPSLPSFLPPPFLPPPFLPPLPALTTVAAAACLSVAPLVVAVYLSDSHSLGRHSSLSHLCQLVRADTATIVNAVAVVKLLANVSQTYLSLGGAAWKCFLFHFLRPAFSPTNSRESSRRRRLECGSCAFVRCVRD